MVYLNVDGNWLKVESFFLSFAFFYQVIIHFIAQSIFPLISHYQNATKETIHKMKELSCITRTSTITRSISLIKVEKCFNGFLLVTMNMKNEQKKNREQKSLREIEMNYIVFAFFYCMYLRSGLKKKNSILKLIAIEEVTSDFQFCNWLRLIQVHLFLWKCIDVISTWSFDLNVIYYNGMKNSLYSCCASFFILKF